MFRIYLGLDILMTIVMTVVFAGCIEGTRRTVRQPRLLLSLVALDISMLLSNVAQYAAAIAGDMTVLHVADCWYCVSDEAFRVVCILYLAEHIRTCGVSVSRRFAVVGACVAVVDAVLWCVSTYNGMFFDVATGSRGPFYWLGQAGGAAVSLIYMYMLIRFRRHFRRSDLIFFSLFLFCPILHFVLRSFLPQVNDLPIAYSFTVILLYEFVHSEQLRRMKEIELELSEAKFAVLTSQIHPHFLYNTMNSIYYLCEKDPAAAKLAILDFSEYMRAILHTPENGVTIPFSRELENIEHYLALEKMRFRELLTYSYEIGTDDFQVPPLSIQILVENAVKHGLEDKPDGGHVLIRSEKTADGIVVTVEDDGVGFPQKDLSDVFGVGLVNARERLRQFCGAEIEIVSAVGEGTKAVVKFPFGNIRRG